MRKLRARSLSIVEATLARLEPRGHSPGLYQPPPEAPHPEFPMTLDLRRPAGV